MIARHKYRGPFRGRLSQRGYLGIGVRRALGGKGQAQGGSGGLPPFSFWAPLTTTIVPSKGSGVPTFTRATTATQTDWEGKLNQVLSGEARFQGARRVRNLAPSTENMNGGSWLQAGGGQAPTVSTQAGVLLPNGSVGSVTKIVFPAISSPQFSFVYCADTSGVAHGSGTFTGSLWIQAVNAPGTVFLPLEDALSGPAAGNYGVASCAVTAAWQRFQNKTVFSAGSGVAIFGVGFDCRNAEPQTTSGITVYVWGAQLENVTGQSNQNPSEYVSVGVLAAPYQGANVDGVQYFAYQNGNTVAANVVTAGSGAAIPTTTLLGYLSEEQRTNLCLWSADFSNAVWTKAAVTIGGSTVLPDGTTGTVNKIQEDNTNSQHYIVQTFAKAASALIYEATVFLKQSERTWGFIQVDDTVIGARAWFNLASGVAGSITLIGAGFTSISSSILPAANGFYRCVLLFTSSAAVTLRLGACAATVDTIVNYLGVTGNGIYGFGGQLEQANIPSIATSYIQTTSAAVTRNVDQLSYPQGGNIATLGDYTIYAEAKLSAVLTGGVSQVVIGSDTLYRPFLDFGSLSLVTFYSSTDAGAFGQASLLDATKSSQVNKIAGRKTSTALTTSVNGVVGAPSIGIGTQGAEINNIRVGSAVGVSLDGTVRNVKIWQRALTDAQLTALTT